ncbi:hypothetical protein RvY_07103-1 [Ramazzottius varieornatus]|uniref:Thyroglobulin type-1 domain-containing protein n=1 Tax=Ramazzottius varieornatus TaxID=947166 RepID=A0A1D1V9I1_RAMVA|nr:hypothetical protein RvY_07103-1 [Ramazzottius varieornatus]
MCSSGSLLVCLVGISALYFSVASAHKIIPDLVVGNYRPQVDSNGNLNPAQCHAGTGYCWCVDWDGTILGENVRGEDPSSLNCEQKRQERMQPPTIADRPPPQHSNGDSTF